MPEPTLHVTTAEVITRPLLQELEVKTDQEAGWLSSRLKGAYREAVEVAYREGLRVGFAQGVQAECEAAHRQPEFLGALGRTLRDAARVVRLHAETLDGLAMRAALSIADDLDRAVAALPLEHRP